MFVLSFLAVIFFASISACKAEVWTDCGHHSNLVPDAFKVHQYDLTFTPNLKKSSFQGQIEIVLELVDTSRPNAQIVLNASHQLKFISVKLAVIPKPSPNTVGQPDKQPVRLTRVCRDRTYDIAVIDIYKPEAVKGLSHRFVVDIQFSGDIKNDHPGLKIVTYPSSSSSEPIYGLYTTFERTNARTVFPCLDDSRFPAFFKLKLQVPSNTIGVTGTPEIGKDISAGSNGVHQEFARTYPIAPQQFGFAIGRFYEKRFQVHAKTTLVFMSSKSFGNEQIITAKVIADAYLKLQFRLGFWDRANPVIVLFPGVGDREFHGSEFMVADQELLEPQLEVWPRETSYDWYNKLVKRLTKQWLGGHVMRASANDVWLFEGLISYISVRMAGNLYKKGKFSAIMHYSSSVLRGALMLDSQYNTQPTIPAVDGNGVGRADYQLSLVGKAKSLAMIQVLRDICGLHNFNAIIADTKLFRDRALTTTDLLTMVTLKCYQNSTLYVDSLLFKPGYPLIEVDMEEDGSLIFKSERFRSDYSIEWPFFPDHQYSHPITLRFGRILDDKEIGQSQVMIGDKITRHKCPVPDYIDWYVTTNPLSLEYYRTLYSDKLLDRIYRDNRPIQLPYTNLLNIVSDAFALVQAGRVGVYYLIKVIVPIQRIECGWLDDIVLKSLQFLKLLFRDTFHEENTNKFFIAYFAPKFRKWGYKVLQYTSERAKKAQIWIYETLVILGYRPLVDIALEKYRIMDIDPDFLSLTFIAISRYGDEDEFTDLLNLLRDAGSAELEMKLINGLALSSTQERLRAAWESVLRYTPTNALDFLLVSLLNPEGRSFVEGLFTDLNMLRIYTGPEGLYRLLKEYSIVAQGSRAIPAKLHGFAEGTIRQLINEVQAARHRNKFVRNRDIEKLVWPDLDDTASSSQSQQILSGQGEGEGEGDGQGEEEELEEEVEEEDSIIPCD